MSCPVEIGCYPWAPVGSTALEVWHMHNIPLMGTFESKGIHWVFSAMEADFNEVQDGGGLWTYWTISQKNLDEMPENLRFFCPNG